MKEFKYDVIQLIEGVRDRPCLWDKTLENYKDRVERRAAWEQIFSALDDSYEVMAPDAKRITGEIILNKWTNIRDTFMKTLKTKMGKPRRKYLLYDHLKFLIKIISDEEKAELHEEYYIKQELEPQTSYSNEETKTNYYSELNTADINDGNHKRKSKRDTFDELRGGSEVGYRQKKKSRKRQDETKKKKSRAADDSIVADDTRNDETDVDIAQADDSNDARLMNDPRLMNEDEAFFASLLPSVVRYNEDERLQFRIEVLAVMRRIKEKRKLMDD